MNKELITRKLIAHQYPEKQASLVASELMAVDSSLVPYLEDWIETDSETDYSVSGFSLMKLKDKYQMTYPAALLTIDWLIKEPEVAANAINRGIR